MDRHVDYQPCSQMLIVNNSQAEMISSCSILASFDQTYISLLEAQQILSWVQQHQPDLIVLDLPWSQVIDSQLITALRLDWLTRNIPILMLADAPTLQLQPMAALDCNAYLTKPYSPSALEQAICSLVPHPACESSSQTVLC